MWDKGQFRDRFARHRIFSRYGRQGYLGAPKFLRALARPQKRVCMQHFRCPPVIEIIFSLLLSRGRCRCVCMCIVVLIIILFFIFPVVVGGWGMGTCIGSMMIGLMVLLQARQ